MLSVDATCRLVANYTDAGDPVADLNHDPHTSAAAAWLGRQPLPVDSTDPRRPTSATAARLVIARLPVTGVHCLAGATSWMRHVREQLLAPGGYLLAIVVPTIRAGRYLDRATTVIAAREGRRSHLAAAPAPHPHRPPRAGRNRAGEGGSPPGMRRARHDSSFKPTDPVLPDPPLKWSYHEYQPR